VGEKEECCCEEWWRLGVFVRRKNEKKGKEEKLVFLKGDDQRASLALSLKGKKRGLLLLVARVCVSGLSW
jgi:hypothetical protein